ncbi:hypothetical protein [Pseudomonas syringae]|nr:hypothetical protein [Pseudomonas syringae]
MMTKQSSKASPKDVLKARKGHLLSLMGVITGGQKKLNTVQTLTVQAMKSESSHVDRKLQQFG